MKVYLEEIKGLTIGRSISLPKGTSKIGRKDSDINIPNQRISQNHAEIHFSGTRVFVIDRNSTNGTFVNGKKVERIALRDGDIISFGGQDETSSAEFKVHIISIFSRRRVVVIVKKAGRSNRFLLITASFILVCFAFWLFLPSDSMDNKKNEITDKPKDVSNPWVGAAPLADSSVINGSIAVLSLGDEVLLPEQIRWDAVVSYDNAKNSDPFDDLMYVTAVSPLDEDDHVDIKEKVVSTITVQKFKNTFSSDITPYVEHNFKWHESEFLKDNEISDARFEYSVTTLCTWQSIIWEKETKFNLYASCITRRGRIIIQASAFDASVLKRFFLYVAGSYKEGIE